MRTTTPTTRRSQPAPSRGWWQAALWLPVGYAATQGIGEATPLPAMVALTAVLAGLHGFVPGLVELAVGSAGLLMSTFVAIDGRGCGELLGDGGSGVVLVFGSIMWLSALVRLLGSANGREMARHLLVATAALEIGLFAVGPMGQLATAPRHHLTTPVVLASVLLVTTVFGCRARNIGFPVLGVGLVVVEALSAVAGGACESHPVTNLAGSVTFALLALLLASRPEGPDLEDLPATPTG